MHLDLAPALAADWLPAQADARPDASLKNVLADALPKRLAQRLCEIWFGQHPMRQYSEDRLRQSSRRCTTGP